MWRPWGRGRRKPRTRQTKDATRDAVAALAQCATQGATPGKPEEGEEEEEEEVVVLDEEESDDKPLAKAATKKVGKLTRAQAVAAQNKAAQAKRDLQAARKDLKNAKNELAELRRKLAAATTPEDKAKYHLLLSKYFSRVVEARRLVASAKKTVKKTAARLRPRARK